MVSLVLKLFRDKNVELSRSFQGKKQETDLLVVVVELANLGGDLAYLPPLEVVLAVEDVAVLLLELPQLRVDVKGAAEVGLPLLVPILRQIPVTNHIQRLFPSMSSEMFAFFCPRVGFIIT